MTIPIPDDTFDPLLRLESGGTEIALIRHGHAVPGVAEIAAGTYNDQPLSALGQRQAWALAERFRLLPVAAVYSSPILRARQTAEAVAEIAGLPLLIDAALREVDLTSARPDIGAEVVPEERVRRLRAYLREIEAQALRVGVWSAIPGVESSAQVRERITGALRNIAARHPGRRVAVVSHNGAINAAIAALLGLDRDFFFPAANASLSLIRLHGERGLVVTINDHAHLAGLEDA